MYLLNMDERAWMSQERVGNACIFAPSQRSHGTKAPPPPGNYQALSGNYLNGYIFCKCMYFQSPKFITQHFLDKMN